MIKITAGMQLISCVALLGQTFEVASIEPADPSARGSSIGFPNGTFTAINAPPRNPIALAYDVQPFQIEGSPNWTASQRYDILAKMPAGAVKGPRDPNRPPLMRAALQALLADRFQMAVHRETKVMPAYVLAVAKSGPKLKETADDGRGLSINQDRGKLVAERISLAAFARALSGSLGSAVVDRTGINGVFDLNLQWAPDEGAGSAEPSAGSFDFHGAARATWLETGDAKGAGGNDCHRPNRKAGGKLVPGRIPKIGHWPRDCS